MTDVGVYAIAIGRLATTVRDYELCIVVNEDPRRELRTIMTEEEYEVVHAVIIRGIRESLLDITM